jgi:HK97 family phage major capsid protein
MNKSPGQQITDMLLEHPEKRRFDIAMDRKAILVYPSTATTVPRVTPGPSLPLRLRDLIPGGTITGDGIIYVRETSITNSVVAPIAPGGVKPQADMTYDVQIQPAVTIPAYMKLPAQYWEDFAMFQSWIDNRVLYSLSLAEENQLLNGNGVAPNLQGLMLVAIATTSVAGSGGAALLDNVAAGIGALYSRDYTADGIVVNPTDWGNALNAKVAGGGYLLGPPALVENPARLWGLPVVISKAMASGKYLVGQFNPFSQIFDRDTASVEVADQNQDDFIRNLVAVRAEERIAFAIYQPGAFAKGTFTP